MPSLRAIIAYISQTPPRLFWAFALTHLVLWTAIPSLVSPNMPLDVIEGYAWGKEWLIGTHKHPPMQAWILETLFQATGRSRWVPYLASQLCIITAFWAVWQTGRRIAGEKAGLIGAMLLEGIIYYNFTSPEFNPNVLQIPFWALAGTQRPSLGFLPLVIRALVLPPGLNIQDGSWCTSFWRHLSTCASPQKIDSFRLWDVSDGRGGFIPG